jgi:hypothetical protein
MAAGNSSADPMFVNANAGDFHLKAGSPAVNVGVTLAEVAADIDGVVRPQGNAYDIGAYEFVTQSAQSSSLTSLTSFSASIAALLESHRQRAERKPLNSTGAVIIQTHNLSGREGWLAPASSHISESPWSHKRRGQAILPDCRSACLVCHPSLNSGDGNCSALAHSSRGWRYGGSRFSHTHGVGGIPQRVL